ncbi:hypothetical protein [Clostridium brassicae]|uniref:hypothetical protein n=1 Tax=Clostridium brassicae TaxID=2999072 RepID=UPI00227AA025|nr:hypothetical protein [Clostridium brassicae]
MKKNKVLTIIVLIIALLSLHSTWFTKFKYNNYITSACFLLLALIVFLSKD